MVEDKKNKLKNTITAESHYKKYENRQLKTSVQKINDFFWGVKCNHHVLKSEYNQGNLKSFFKEEEEEEKGERKSLKDYKDSEKDWI